MNSSYIGTKPNWIFWCVKDENGFTAMGSRRINHIDLEVDYKFDDHYMTFDNPFHSPSVTAGISGPVDYLVSGSMRGITMVTGKTEIEAICSLLTVFREDEERERHQAELTAARRETQELRNKEMKRLHKKTMKRRAEGKFDANYCEANCYWCYDADQYDCCEDCG